MKFSYIDPGTGSMLISATIALFSVGFFMLKGVVYRKFNIGGVKGEILDPNMDYGLVFYSEGKQYWNVFKPILQEASKQGVSAYYFTSDKDDPGLDAAFESIVPMYIGSGREAFFSLNRLTADMVVMTTPGLDVLEIKRSKNVKHYCHIGHSLGSIAGYKAYGVDYFDSVLLGGQGDIVTIRELEKIRNLPSKNIEIVGHTYLDVARNVLESSNFDYTLFKEKRTTVLVSPTWGNHGLLTKYGEELLNKLVSIDKYNIIIRPHPQSFVSDKEVIDKLMIMFPESTTLQWNRDISNLKAMSHADIMISDFSGIIFDFFSLFKKPILTFNAQYEKRGRDAIDLNEDPWDIQMLDKIGRTIDANDIEYIEGLINQEMVSFSEVKEFNELARFIDTYPRQSGLKSLVYIKNVLSSLRKESHSVTPTVQETDIYKGEVIYNQGSNVSSIVKSLFNPSMLLQYTLASSLLTLYTYMATKILKQGGLNQVYFKKLLPYTIVLMSISFIVLVLVTILLNKGKLVFRKEFEKPKLGEVLYILLPLAPIVQYVFANQDLLNMSETIVVIFNLAVLAFLIVFVVPTVFSVVISKNLVSSISVVLLYIVYNMASFGRTTSVMKITLIFFLTAFGIYLIRFFKQGKLVIIAISIFFLTTTVTAVTSSVKSKTEITFDNNPKILDVVRDKTIVNKPNIYVLAYDSYPNQETTDYYGYDNSEQIKLLLDFGFTIYDGTYSTSANTYETVSSLLNVEKVANAVPVMGEVIARSNALLRLTQMHKYRTKLVLPNDYLTKGQEPSYDVVFPNAESSIDPSKIIIDAILEGEFRFDVEYSKVTYDDYLSKKNHELSSKDSNPSFIYTHSNYPGHSQNSGVLRPNETELFFERLDKANIEMRNDLTALNIDKGNSIVIVLGDHGPYLTKNGIGLSSYSTSEIDRLDIQDRYGTFLGILWPNDIQDFDIKIVQDIVPAIAAYIYDDSSIFTDSIVSRDVIESKVIGKASIRDGYIVGGINDGEPLFMKNGRRSKH